MIKKFTLCVILFALSATSAWGNAKVILHSYMCKDCEKYFYCFDGDDLSKVEYMIPSNQLARVFKLANPQINLPACKGKQTHTFVYNMTRELPIGTVVKYAQQVAVIKGGPKLKTLSFSSWWCRFPDCKDPFIIYSLGNDNFILQDWEQQQGRIINCKTLKGIVKCQAPGVPGHAFLRDEAHKNYPLSSYSFAEMLEDFYFTTN